MEGGWTSTGASRQLLAIETGFHIQTIYKIQAELLDDPILSVPSPGGLGVTPEVSWEHSLRDTTDWSPGCVHAHRQALACPGFPEASWPRLYLRRSP